MSSLKSVFILTLIRLMHREPCLTITREMNHYPTEAEMLEFLESCIELDEGSRNFETIMKVEKIYRVVPSEMNEPVSPMRQAWQKTFAVDPDDVRPEMPREKDFREQYLDTPKEEKL